MELVNFDSLRVSYRVNDNNGAYKVRDIVIEDVSLVTTHRQEFASLAASGGIEKVIAKLEEMNAQFAAQQRAMVQMFAGMFATFVVGFLGTIATILTQV